MEALKKHDEYRIPGDIFLKIFLWSRALNDVPAISTHMVIANKLILPGTAFFAIVHFRRLSLALSDSFFDSHLLYGIINRKVTLIMHLRNTDIRRAGRQREGIIRKGEGKE